MLPTRRGDSSASRETRTELIRSSFRETGEVEGRYAGVDIEFEKARWFARQQPRAHTVVLGPRALLPDFRPLLPCVPRLPPRTAPFPLFEFDGFESRALDVKAQDLRHLVDEYVVD